MHLTEEVAPETWADLAVGEYRFKRVWACLRKQGWYSKSGGTLSYDHFYIKPGKDIERGVEGVDYFYGEATLVQYAIDIGLFDTPGNEETYSSATSESGGTPTAGARAQPMRAPSGDSNGASTHVTTSADERLSQSGEKKPKNGKAPAHPKVKQVIPSRQWPPSHKFKGRHANDAISLLDSDDSEEEDDTPVKPGKRKMNRVETEEEEEDTGEEQDNGLSADDGMYSDEGDDTQSNATMESEDGSVTSGGKRPLLKTRVSKKVKIEAADERYRNRYKSKSKGVAHKVKSAPRGVMFQPNASLKTHGKIALEETPPPKHKASNPAPESSAIPSRHPQHSSPPQKPKVAHILSSAFEGTIKTELPPFSPPSPPTRPPSRASSVASSHHSGPAAPRMKDPSPSGVTRTVFDVDGVVFKSVPDVVYRVSLSTSDSDESTLVLEEQKTKRRQSFSFPDITQISQEAPGSFPRHVLELAFFQALKDVGKEAIVSPPPPAVVKEEAIAANGTGTISGVDLCCDEEGVNTVVLSFPFTPFYSPSHRFPLTPVPESEQVQVLMQELEQTKKELESTRSDMEAFKKQHEMLEREYQKARKEAEQLRRATQQETPPVQTSAVSSPASSHPRVQVNTGIITAGLTTVRMNARTFHGHASWLSTAFPPSPGSLQHETWPIVWDNVVMSTSRLYDVSSNGIKFADVEVKVRGSYQLNVFVTHNPAVSLEIAITNPVHTPVTPVITPSLIQIAESEDNKKCTSRFDCIVECNVNDTIHVRSRSRNPSNPMNGPIVWLRTFSPPPNTWLMNYVDKHFLKTNEEEEQKEYDQEHRNGTDN